MDKNIEQRICLKFCIANGISFAESLKMLQKAYGESTLSKTRAYEFYSAFKSGRDVVELFSSIIVVLCTRNSYQKVRRQIKKKIRRKGADLWNEN